MPMTKMKDIESKSDKDLSDFVAEKREAVRNFRFTHSSSRTRNVRQIRADKKDIARALTEQTKRTKEAQDKANNK